MIMDGIFFIDQTERAKHHGQPRTAQREGLGDERPHTVDGARESGEQEGRWTEPPTRGRRQRTHLVEPRQRDTQDAGVSLAQRVPRLVSSLFDWIGPPRGLF